ncbi:MAG: elongation factor P [Mycoplasmatales bacterium]
MIGVNDLKNGLTIKYNNNLYQVMEFQHVKPGKGPAFVRTKLRNLDTKSIQDITFNSNEKVEKALVEKKQMQYLYNEGNGYIFMDMETYEQLTVEKEYIEDQLKFLIENTVLQIIMHEGKIIGINLPEKMELEIIECEPGIKGDTKSGGDKTATLETGFVIRVPLFVEVGNKVVINTEKGTYVSRV